MSLRSLASLPWRNPRTWALTVLFVLAPLGSVLFLVYLVARGRSLRRSPATPDPYQEWWALRDLRRREPYPGVAGLGSDAAGWR